ncbi:MAG: MATE family efflux transporter [Lentisphaerae bacterium]|nr:MATE family efflux transporter [Lentisphaerota bacterium]
MRLFSLKRKQSYQVDMCHGPLLWQIIRFTIPLIISGVLQMLFHSADLIVIGQLTSEKALAAVGATGSLTMLLINIFIGLSIGTNVLVARYLGKNSRKDTSRTVHTAIMTSLFGGAFLAAAGITLAKPMLKLMGTPEDILDMSALYMWVYFGGMPAVMLYNFGSAVLRAMGDTTRPFYFLLFSGIINVLLNLFFVIVFHWDVAGVAAATVISQAIAGVLVLRVLYKMRGPCRFKWQNLRFKWKNMRELLWIGVPAGFQASCFSLSNILIQSALNTFGSAAIAGLTAGGTLEMLSYVAQGAIGQTVVSFVGQNHGAKNFDRMKKSIIICVGFAACCALVVETTLLTFSRPLLSVFNTNPEVIAFGVRRLWCTLPLLFICSSMDVMTGALRGMGHSVAPTGITLTCICALRVVWLYTVFAWYPTLEVVLLSYPVTWVLNAAGVGILLVVTFRKEKRKCLAEAAAAQA